MRRALALAALAIALPAAAADAPVPALTGPVVDQAGLLDPASRRQLEDLSRAARAQQGGNGVQLQYLIVDSLQGEPIEDYSMRVAEAWKIGSRAEDNGVLVVLAVKDRTARIEVGAGIEGGLTDLQASRIIRETMTPAFRAGRFGEGLYRAGTQILGALGSLPADVPRARGTPAVRSSPSVAILGLFMLFFLFRIFSGFGPRRRRVLWWGLPWMGGGWGRSGGGGGGGWGGGGGGFGGGGASGRW